MSWNLLFILSISFLDYYVNGWYVSSSYYCVTCKDSKRSGGVNNSSKFRVYILFFGVFLYYCVDNLRSALFIVY